MRQYLLSWDQRGVMSPRWGLVLRNLRPLSLVVYNAQRRTRQAPREGMRGTSCFAKGITPLLRSGAHTYGHSPFIHIVSFSSLPKRSSLSCVQLSFYLPLNSKPLPTDQLYTLSKGPMGPSFAFPKGLFFLLSGKRTFLFG